MQVRVTADGKVDIYEITVHNQLYSPEQDVPFVEEEPIVRTRVFTDGELVSESPVTEYPIIMHCFSNGERLFRPVDTKKTKTLQFKDYSYIITYVLAREPFKVNDTREMLTNVKDITVYLRNPKDRKAKRMVKEVIKEIYRQNKRMAKVDRFVTLFQHTFAFNTYNNPYEFDKKTKDVYKVSKNQQR